MESDADFTVGLMLFLMYFVPICIAFVILGALAERLIERGARTGECGEPTANGQRCRREWWHHGEHRA